MKPFTRRNFLQNAVTGAAVSAVSSDAEAAAARLLRVGASRTNPLVSITKCSAYPGPSCRRNWSAAAGRNIGFSDLLATAWITVETIG